MQKASTTLQGLDIGRVIRRRQLAELSNHSLKWVDLEAGRKNTVLVKVRNSQGRAIGFTEASVRKLLGCTVKGVSK